MIQVIPTLLLFFSIAFSWLTPLRRIASVSIDRGPLQREEYMRDEFASYSFLALAMVGAALLCFSLLALAFA
jgi:hypothetical protein